MPVSIGDDVYFLQDYVATLANGRTYKRYAAGSTYTADAKNVDFLDAGVTAGNGYVTGGAIDASVRTFLALEDAPKSYSGEGGNLVAVNMAEDGLEFVPPSGGGSGSVDFFTDLGDVPASYSGQALKVVRVNAGETGLEFATSSGGGSAGTPPTIVQYGSSLTSKSVVLGIAPTNGNLLVAVVKAGSNSWGAGWTQQDLNAAGTNYSNILTKVAGGAESTTQTPLGADANEDAICMWEIAGASATPIVFANSTVLSATNLFFTCGPGGPAADGTPDSLPGLTNVLTLAAIFTDGTSPQTLTAAMNMTQQELSNSGTYTHFVSGHSDGDTPVAQLLSRCTSTTVATRAGIIHITA